MQQRHAAYRASAFGYVWRSDVRLEHFSQAVAAGADADIVVGRVSELPERAVLAEINRGQIFDGGIRFRWGDEVVFEILGGDRIDYCPGPDWKGAMPWPFFSTVTALLLGVRGGIPFHASAVAIDGRGVMICGESGAGKSSLAAALVAQGAAFLSDDLSVVFAAPGQSGFRLVPGRPGIRLFPELARAFPNMPVEAAADDVRGKMMVTPPAEMSRAAPLEQIVFLGGEGCGASAIDRFLSLQASMFRPKWMAALPNAAAKRLAVSQIAATVSVTDAPAIGGVDAEGLHRKAAAIADDLRHCLTA